jgi:Zn-dependent protease with chaperone function
MPPPPVPADVAVERQRQYAEAARHLLGHMERVARVGARVTVASAPICADDVKPYVGIVSASRESLQRRLGRHSAWTDVGTALQSAWALGAGTEVLAVLPDSPAARVGIRAGDRVLTVEPESERAGSPLQLEVERGGKVLRVALPYVAECTYTVVATFGDVVNARSNHDGVVINTSLLRFVESDDELAFAIGHELAHRILGHRRSGLRNREHAADYLGVYLAARAGYDPEAAVRFVRRLAAEHPELISERASPWHPGTAGRATTLERAAAEARAKQSAGTELLPEGL